MLRFLPSPLLGIVSLILYTLNTLFWVFLLFDIALIMWVMPTKRLRKWWHNVVYLLPEKWSDGNNAIMDLHTQIEWKILGIEDLKQSNWYLMISNHQSWLDILIINKVFNRKIPTLRFFMKKELKWQLPFVAQACMILDFPFMKRYSKEFLRKHPELKGQDVETTRNACKKFKNIPTTMIIFPEGGRFNKTKHKRQNSSYKYLLKPKAGGVAFILETMGKYLQTVLNVTIIYPEKEISFWNFLCGKVHKIVVHVESIPITDELLGNYEVDREYRVRFQQWVNELWRKRDKLIEDEVVDLRVPKIHL